MNLNNDYYAILGVMPTAEDFVIRAVYKALAQRYHPDRFKGSPEELNRKMAEINEAYSILSDPIRRQEYDAHRSQVGEGDSYFDEKTNDKPPEYDPLEQEWKTAVSYYPDLKNIESSLAQISWRLAYAYRVCLLENKYFAKRNEIAVALEQNFLESYFGKNRQIVDFARKLIYQNQKKAARELNKAVSFFGDNIDAELVIAKINRAFNNPLGEVKEQQLKVNDFVNEKDRHASPLFILLIIFIIFSMFQQWLAPAQIEKDSAKINWLDKVNIFRNSIKNGKVEVINGISQYFSTQEAAEQFSNTENPVNSFTKADILSLENNNVWWFEEDNHFYVRVKNIYSKKVSRFLFEFFNGDCANPENSLKEYYLVSFEKPVLENTEMFVNTILKLKNIGKNKKGWCGIIINAW